MQIAVSSCSTYHWLLPQATHVPALALAVRLRLRSSLSVVLRRSMRCSRDQSSGTPHRRARWRQKPAGQHRGPRSSRGAAAATRAPRRGASTLADAGHQHVRELCETLMYLWPLAVVLKRLLSLQWLTHRHSAAARLPFARISARLNPARSFSTSYNTIHLCRSSTNLTQ